MLTPPFTRRLLLVLLATAGSSSFAFAAGPQDHADEHRHERLTQAAPPHQRQSLPPSDAQIRFNLPASTKPRLDLVPTQQAHRLTAPTTECSDLEKMAAYSGTALADYVANLPDVECTYGLFSATSSQETRIYTQDNLHAVANRLALEAARYDNTSRALANLVLYLRAGYYLAAGDANRAPPTSVRDIVRPALAQLMDKPSLFQPNAKARSTASEVMKLITNMYDEGYFLPRVKQWIIQLTNSPANPNASDMFSTYEADAGYTGLLTILYYAHWRPDAKPILLQDDSYATALYNFLQQNKLALLANKKAYQLSDTANELFRFMQHDVMKPRVKPMLKGILAGSSMTGPDSLLWIAAAKGVDYYDKANCAEYGTCNFQDKLIDAVLPNRYTCSPTIRIMAQDMNTEQMQASCAALGAEENYFHTMLRTQRKPVANDNNTSLEVVVFDDYTNYDKYAGPIFDISTNNGGMYLEGNPATPGNQARFIAHEASWMRPQFSIWNLEHEYVHYLDGRFNMYGDFGDSTQKPSVWWIEGIGEYLSLRNNNQKAIDATRSGTYRLSQIFGNTYSMSDYVTRAYRWGYMATRFMMERHRSDVDNALARFRVGDYIGYQNLMNQIGTRYDNEFATWVQQATTDGEPPIPGDLPDCNTNKQLENGCMIRDIGSNMVKYLTLWVPEGATNLSVRVSGGTGNADAYLGINVWPSPRHYHYRSTNQGNEESFNIANPAGGRWHYLALMATKPFAGVTVSASFNTPSTINLATQNVQSR